MSKEFIKEFEPLWSYIDMNGHLRHTGYSDYATNVRVCFFREIGYDLKDLGDIAIGPVILREFMEYKREIRLGDRFKIDLQMTGNSPDSMYWRLRHNVYKLEDDKLCCTINMEGVWIDTKERKMRAPPSDFAAKFGELKKTDDFKILGKRSRMKLEY